MAVGGSMNPNRPFIRNRTQLDGHPYYCEVCKAGYYEYRECDRPDCQLEPVQAALSRRMRAIAAPPGPPVMKKAP
jgi:hypothetical protein